MYIFLSSSALVTFRFWCYPTFNHNWKSLIFWTCCFTLLALIIKRAEFFSKKDVLTLTNSKDYKDVFDMLKSCDKAVNFF